MKVELLPVQPLGHMVLVVAVFAAVVLVKFHEWLKALHSGFCFQVPEVVIGGQMQTFTEVPVVNGSTVPVEAVSLLQITS